jgi:chemotaxis response regulator CheB
VKRPELVAVGTSLGGLNALTRLLGALPERFRVPLVIVQHRTMIQMAAGWGTCSRTTPG